MKQNIFSGIRCSLLGACLLLITSCANSDYVNAIPSESSALISVNLSQVKGINNRAIFKALLHVSNLDKSGIALADNLYLFESPDGNLGLCAGVSDADDLQAALQQGGRKIVSRRGNHFCALSESWVAGFSDNCLLVMGPVTPAAQQDLMVTMARYLNQDEEEGIKASHLYEVIDTIEAPMAMVCQAQALPERFVAPFTLGTPADAEPSQVMISARMQVEKGCLKILGHTFSFNKKIDQALKEAVQTYRPIQGKYLPAIDNASTMDIFMNVDGRLFMPLLQSNKGIQALLAGINAGIDMNNIIKGVDGDLVIGIPTMSDSNLSITMSAQLANASWLADVNYWKQSAPAGSRIFDWGHQAYCYTDGKISFYFGVSADKQFYSGSTAAKALAAIQPSENPLSDDMQQAIKGEKLAMRINLDQPSDNKISFLKMLLRPVVGDIRSILYVLR